MGTFIYVFTDKDKDVLQKLGYELIHSSTINHTHIFLNKDSQTFSSKTIQFVLSDTLTF